jgi:hypothetical protein
MSCQPPATLGNGVVHDHIAWASTRHLGSLGLLSASASRTGARERPSAAKLWPLVAGATDGGQDDQRRLLYANRKVLISPVGENLLVLVAWSLPALCTRDSRAQMFVISVQLSLAGQLHEFGRGGGVSRWSAATHG